MSALASQITSLAIVYSTRLFSRISKKTSKLRVTGLWEGNSPVTGEFPTQRVSNAENVCIWWRHHVYLKMCTKFHFFKKQYVNSSGPPLCGYAVIWSYSSPNFNNRFASAQHQAITQYLLIVNSTLGLMLWHNLNELLHLKLIFTTRGHSYFRMIYHAHYSDVIMSATASQITGVSFVCSMVCSGADHRKYQSSKSLVFVRWIHPSPIDSPHKGPVKLFTFYDVIMIYWFIHYEP